jgi:DNA-binding beta-propeller fold protein YncE
MLEENKMRLTLHGGRISLLTALILLEVTLFPASIIAHPASGIVVDRQGQVYFLDTGSGVYKIDVHGKLTQLPGPRFHWMTIDLDDCFKSVRLPSGARGDITRVGAAPTLLVASDFPLAIGARGSLYYPDFVAGSGLKILELTPSGQTTMLTNLSAAPGGRELQYLNGLTAGSDGSLYYTEDSAIRRISAQRQVSTIITNPKLATCVSIPGTTRPQLRGLTVDNHGTIYVAASGCGSVLKVTEGGQVTTVLQLQSPWTPTSVAVFGSDLYVLEYLQTAASMEPEDRRAWLPRVRRIWANGKTRIIASIDRR